MRTLLYTLPLLLAAAFAPAMAQSVSGQSVHGLSPFGDLKYGPDFPHLDYANPAAPKGGELKLRGIGSFDSFNPFILKGNAPSTGNGPFNLEEGFVWESLMTRAYDEPGAVYGLLAESVTVDDSVSRIVFTLRDEARFHDGRPVTASDVVFTHTMLTTKARPDYKALYEDFASVTAEGKNRVVFTVRDDVPAVLRRDLPLTAASLPVMQEAWFTENNVAFDETTLVAPGGSGPYRVVDVDAGRSYALERNPDYWGKDLPINKGRWNFDRIKTIFFRDRAIALEGFKAGEYDFREEYTSKYWATAYEFPAAAAGKVKRDQIVDDRPSGMQGWFLNIRRAQLADWRVRKALEHTFDFEWTNKALFYGLYKRTDTVFANTAFVAPAGPPEGAELALLEEYRDQLPDRVFGPAWKPPVTRGDGKIRKELRVAGKLLEEAGWVIRDGKRVNESGEQLSLEFLIFSPSFERIISPVVQNMQRLGIDAGIRRIDLSIWVNRIREYDFDATGRRYATQAVPGRELRALFGSGPGKAPGSYNIAGMDHPVIDALIERMIAAENLQDLAIAGQALDRVIMHQHYLIPNWYNPFHNIAWWDRLGRPAKDATYRLSVFDTWWFDADKAAAIGTDQ